MKIEVNKIPLEGLSIEEELEASALDLETGIVKFRGPIKIKAGIFKITNAVTADLILTGLMYLNCGRCLNEFEMNLNKNLRLSYCVTQPGLVIDLDPDIREEIILDYPIKPLCNPGCRGLCPKCGRDLNEGLCDC